MRLRRLALSLVILCPVHAAAQQELPVAYSQCRDPESPEAGIAACTEALKGQNLLQAERARTLLNLAIHNRLAGAYPAAFDALAKAAAIAPNAPAIPAERAIVLHMSGDLAGAKATYAQAFSLGPGSPALFNNRGVTLLALGDAAAAIADFDASLALMTDNHAVLANRATAKCRAGDVAGSVADLAVLIGQDESRAAALEAALAGAGIEGALDADTLARWTAAGCPGAADPEFL